jgi:hypothetical protein
MNRNPVDGTIFDRFDPPKDFWLWRRGVVIFFAVTTLLFPFYPMMFSFFVEDTEQYKAWVEYLVSISGEYFFLAGSIILSWVTWSTFDDKWKRDAKVKTTSFKYPSGGTQKSQKYDDEGYPIKDERRR